MRLRTPPASISAISGSGSLTKVGGGDLNIYNPGTWTGGTFANAGNLITYQSGIIPGAVTLGSGTLAFVPDLSTVINFTNPITGAGTVSLLSAAQGRLIVTASNNFSGVADVFGGFLQPANSNAVGSIRVRGGTTSTGRLDLLGSIRLNGKLSVDVRQSPIVDALHVLNVSGNNTLAGNVTGNGNTNGPGDWNFQTDSGKLTVSGNFLNGGTNNGNLKLSGAAVGEWSGAISNNIDNSSLTAVVKNGSGTWILSGSNVYTGTTTVNAGTLVVNGIIPAGGSVTFAPSTTLAGGGTIAAPLTLDPSCTLSPGYNGFGALTIQGDLSLPATTVMKVNRAGATTTNDSVQGVNNLTFGGTLNLFVSGDAFQGGEAFVLFNSAHKAGTFASITPATPGSGLIWDFSTLYTDGTVRVVSTVAHPHISSVSSSGGNLLLSGNGGTANGIYYVLSSTNVALQLSLWPRIATNNFDASGNFNFSQPISSTINPAFFVIAAPQN